MMTETESRRRRGASPLLFLLGVLALSGCGQIRGKNPEFTVYDPKEQRIRERYGTVTGQDGISLFGFEHVGVEGPEHHERGYPRTLPNVRESRPVEPNGPSAMSRSVER